MRSDRDKRTDTEREIDEFLSKFDNPADELSTDIDSYLDDENAANKTPVQTFSWKQVDSPDITKAYKNPAASSSFSSEKTVIVNNNAVKDSSPAEIKVSDNKEESEKLSWVERRRKAKEKKDPVTDVKENKAAAADASDTSDAVVTADSVPSDADAADVEDAYIEDTSESADAPVESSDADDNSAAEDAELQEDKPAKKGKSKKKAKAAKKARTAKRANIKRALFLTKNKDYDPEKGASYVKNGKKIKNKEYRFSFLKLLRDCVALGLICVMAGMAVALSFIIAAPKYDYKDIYSEIDTSSIVYNDEGKQIDNIFYTENRKVVKYEDMPEDLINSFVAIEDKTYYTAACQECLSRRHQECTKHKEKAA